eukprot:m.81953 g.81953  ORF g.81953 m.81953 type:complete len:482 (+) comp11045_c0_seq2:42-1487(+)
MDGVVRVADGPLSSILHALVDGVPMVHVVIEVVLMLLLLKVVFFTKKKSAKHLSAQDEQTLLDEWEPEVLVNPSTLEDEGEPIVVEGVVGTHVKINGDTMLNLASFNFLGMVGREEPRARAEAAARQYGIGSCGPRGFYGTIDCHLQLEDDLAKFMQVEEAIIYSYGFSTIASVIPAYCKRGDIIYFDKGVTFSIQKGLVASRSRLIPFEHNDMADLERLLMIQAEEDKKDVEQARAIRRFVVVEGLYEYSGDIAPLDKLVELKYKYKVRLFVEESMSFGVLGKHGKGATEHFGIDPAKVDCIAAAMGNALGSIGGFALGRSYVIDHQRLSGAGYCYSASLPPLLAVACIEALKIIQKSNGEIQTKLLANAQLMRQAASRIDQVNVDGWDKSPIAHLRLANQDLNRTEQCEILSKVVTIAREKSLAVVCPQYVTPEEFYLPTPSIRLAVSSEHTAVEIENAVKTLGDIFRSVNAGHGGLSM